MSNVHHLFGGEPEPAAANSEWVEEFIDGPLSHLVHLLQQMHEATDEEEFREAAQELKQHVSTWQV